MITDDMKTVAQKCNLLPSDMDLDYIQAAPTIRFSNTGRRGEKKSFDISLVSLTQTLRDINNNFDEFAPHSRYVEDSWRRLFSRYLTDDAVNALSTVQSLPLFTVIAKILHITNNIQAQYIEKTMSLSQANLLTAIKYLESQIPEEEAYLALIQNASLSQSGVGENIIYYGAPGTGKSFEISKLTNDANSTRTVFHPDTQYSDFVGCLKPSMDGNNIQYSFRAGPFTEAVIRSIQDPEHHHYLIIEEINRAPAAAVFGEIFQLLDRDASGTSMYPVDISDPDFLEYLIVKLGAKWSGSKLRVPSNLTILATMNSSDQAVMPLDTAFKRRWKFKYQKLDFSSSATGSIPLTLSSGGSIKEYKWSEFAQVINQILSENSIPEDRHLGPWFVTDDELSSEKVASTLTGKLFMYLWDDVLRHGRSTLVFDESIKTYGNLITLFEAKEAIFSEVFIKKLEAINTMHVLDEAPLIDQAAGNA